MLAFDDCESCDGCGKVCPNCGLAECVCQEHHAYIACPACSGAGGFCRDCGDPQNMCRCVNEDAAPSQKEFEEMAKHSEIPPELRGIQEEKPW